MKTKTTFSAFWNGIKIQLQDNKCGGAKNEGCIKLQLSF